MIVVAGGLIRGVLIRKTEVGGCGELWMVVVAKEERVKLEMSRTS